MTGGSTPAQDPVTHAFESTTGEIYDSSTGAWTAIPGTMQDSRTYHTATRLNDGRVLVAGGYYFDRVALRQHFVTSADVYTPATNAWTHLASHLAVSRYLHSATPLVDGRVILFGGAVDPVTGSTAVSGSSEIFQPATGTFSSVASTMTANRQAAQGAMVGDGRVAVTGGTNGAPNGGDVSSSQLFDPATQSWGPTLASMITARHGHAIAPLLDGEVLVAGGANASAAALASAELFDPAAGTWRAAPNNLSVARSLHAMTRLSDRRILIAGGWDGVSTTHRLKSAELFDSSGSRPSIFLTSPVSLPDAAESYSETAIDYVFNSVPPSVFTTYNVVAAFNDNQKPFGIHWATSTNQGNTWAFHSSASNLDSEFNFPRGLSGPELAFGRHIDRYIADPSVAHTGRPHQVVITSLANDDAPCDITCGENKVTAVIMVISNDDGLHFNNALWLNTNIGDCVDEPLSRSDDNGTVWTTWNCSGTLKRFLQRTSFGPDGTVTEQSVPVEIDNLMGTRQLTDESFSTAFNGDVDMSVARSGPFTSIAFAYDSFSNEDPPDCSTLATSPSPTHRQRWFSTLADVTNFPVLAPTDFKTSLIHEDGAWPKCAAPVKTGSNIAWPRTRPYQGTNVTTFNTSVVRSDGSPAGTRAVLYVGPFTSIDGHTNPYPDDMLWDVYVPRCDGTWLSYSTDNSSGVRVPIAANQPINVGNDSTCDQLVPSLATIPSDIHNGPAAKVFSTWHDTRDGGNLHLTDMWYSVAQLNGISDPTTSLAQQRLTPLDVGVPWAPVDGASHGHTPWGDYESMVAVPLDGLAYAAWADTRPNRDFQALVSPRVWVGSFQ